MDTSRRAPDALAPTPIMAAGLGFSLIVYLSCRPWNLYDGPMIGAPFGRDFVNFWVGGRLAIEGSLSTLTDFAAYNRLIAAAFGHVPTDALMFSYPPHMLLFLAPLACLPYAAALVAWTGLNLLGLAWTTRQLTPGRRTGLLVSATLISPAAFTMVLYGHFGGLMAAAIAVVVLDGQRRPILAGLCLALLTVKPQFALLLSIVLLGAGRWRCLPVALVATAALVALSVALFGGGVWHGFFAVTLPEQNRLLAAHEIGMLHTTISVLVAARTLHLPVALVWLLQLAVSAAALLVAVSVLRRRDTAIATMSSIPLALVVALPYANHYDLVIAAPALTILLLQQGADTTAGIVRLIAWLIPPLAWHLTEIGLPLTPAAVCAVLFEPTVARPGGKARERIQPERTQPS